jgi:hypothetical protein
MHRFIFVFAFSSALAACMAEGGDDTQCVGGKCDGGKDVCEIEARYGNGTCDTDCAEADVDCFLFFDDQAQANAWFAQFEATLAMQEVRQPRALVPPSDPRFTRMRELLDRGWESYKKSMPVGLLDQAPELVIIDDPTPNAFVARDRPSNKAAWTVMVQTGAMVDQSDGALLGVVMHELTHAVRLHILEGIAERMRIHYQIGFDGAEPIGKEQRDNPRAREAITAWRDLGEDAGGSAYAELNGMPMPNSTLSTMLNAAIAKADVSQCPTTIANVTALQTFLTEHTNPLTNLLQLATPADRSQLDQLTRAFLTDLRDVCLANVHVDLFELMAAHFGVSKAEVEKEFPAAEQQMVAGKHIVDQITILAGDRHRRMREIAQLLDQDTQRDITTLRYFSSEEEADDSTVPVLRGMGLPADGVGTFFKVLMPEQVRSVCDDLVDGGMTPPYGDLVDEHHATCWRIAHVKQLARLQSPQGARTVVTEPAPATGEYSRIAGQRLPRFWRASDDISHARR